MTSWVQRLDDPGSRVTIPHSGTPQRRWEVDAAYTFFEGRRYPVAARGERVTDEWTLDTVWGVDHRADAEAFLALLRAVALEPGGRFELHLEPTDGAMVHMTAACRDVPQDLGAGRTGITVTLRQVAV
jgi:hypothetical protein